jgi:two-component system sensor histidine kinase SenX3
MTAATLARESTSVTMRQDALVATLVAVGLILFVIVFVAWRSRRALVRRLTTMALRLEDQPPARDPRTVDGALTRLERAGDRTVLRVRDASLGEARLAGALESIPQGLVICDEQGDTVYRNAAAAAFGSARHGEALVGATIAELLDRALAGVSEAKTLELFGPPRRTLAVSAVPVDDGVHLLGALAIIDDVSDRRRLEAVRRDFVANISHELKTPIGALGLLAETLSSEDDPAVAKRLAERMQSEAFRVSRTIDDLLELSRIEAEEAPPREPVPVNLVVAEAVERVRSAADNAGIEFRVEEPPRRLTFLGDRRQLTSALANLLENAVKYSDRGSEVAVRIRTDGSMVDVIVQDHGIGIPARDLERVFERFYRVDRARSRETGGTGLGLAIVRHVASNHGGEVSVESREGEGSTFTLHLPAGPGPVAVTKAQAG